MIVRRLQDMRKTERRVESPDGVWESTRLLLRDDNVGFSLHVTTICKGADFRMHYTNHFEAVYCLQGTGEVECVDDSTKHKIEPGTMYCLDRHDEHTLRAFEDMKLVCVFNPPLVGKEVHNAAGSYELHAGKAE